MIRRGGWRSAKWAFGVSVVLALAAASPRSEAYLSSTWYEDAGGYQEAARRQKLLNAPLLVYFRVDWCPYCRAFDQLLEDQTVRARLASYIKVRVNPEHGKAERALFEEKFGAKGYPALFLQRSEAAAPSRLSARGPADAFVAQFPE
jgi:hypothetical protein